MNVSLHQNSFLPYIGFWHKVINSDTFILSSAFDFSTSEMYHRTYFPNFNSNKLDLEALEYFTLETGKTYEGRSIFSVVLSDDAVRKAKERMKNIFNSYKKHFGVKNQYLQDRILSIFDENELHIINEELFNVVYDYLELECNVYVNDTFVSKLDTKTDRLIEQLRHFENDNLDDYTYVSGSGGRAYMDLDKLYSSGINTVFQETIDNKYYHGSILHYLLTMPKDEIVPYINSKFKLVN